MLLASVKTELTPRHLQREIYCFNYRQQELITTLRGLTPAGPWRGQGGSQTLFTKRAQGLGN